jgi:hypothetical protein
VQANVPTPPAVNLVPSVAPNPPPPPDDVSSLTRNARLVSDELLITPTWPALLSKPDVAIQSTTRFVPAVVVPGDHEKLVSDVISVPVVSISNGVVVSNVPPV